jgi:hypothetical protein
MQTLGLASDTKPTDGMFKRLFWPTIENQYDVDLVGQQGFWVCTVVAAVTTVALIVMGQVVLGVLIGVTYFLAGMGVRERSLSAALVIFLCYGLDKIASFAMMRNGLGGGNPLFGIVALMLLFANVRATVLTRRWSKTARASEAAGELPERTMDSWTDKLSNGLPAVAWPKMRWVFYPLGILLLLLEVLAVIGGAKARPKAVQLETPSATYEVRPTQ